MNVARQYYRRNNIKVFERDWKRKINFYFKEPLTRNTEWHVKINRLNLWVSVGKAYNEVTKKRYLFSDSWKGTDWEAMMIIISDNATFKSKWRKFIFNIRYTFFLT